MYPHLKKFLIALWVFSSLGFLNAAPLPSLPEGGRLFFGVLQGKVTQVATNAANFEMAVSMVTPKDRNKATHPNSLIGQKVMIFGRSVMNTDSNPVLAQEDLKFIDAMKPEQITTVSVGSWPAKPDKLIINWYAGSKSALDLTPSTVYLSSKK
jgi:hypothetical protein